MQRTIAAMAFLLLSTLFSTGLHAGSSACPAGQYQDFLDNGTCRNLNSATGYPDSMPEQSCIEHCAAQSSISGSLIDPYTFDNCTAQCPRLSSPSSTANTENAGNLAAPFPCPAGEYPDYLDDGKCKHLNNQQIPRHAPTAACIIGCIGFASGRFPGLPTGPLVNPVSWGTCASKCGNNNDTPGWFPSGYWKGTAPACDGTCDASEFAWCVAGNVPGCAYSSAATPDQSSFGSNCSSGRKAYCVSISSFPQVTDAKQVNDPANKSGWHGTAPACDGQCPSGYFAACRSKDGNACDYQGGIPRYMVWGDFGAPCSSGRKVMCLKVDFLQK